MRARLYRVRLRQAVLLGVFLSLAWAYLQVGLLTGTLKDETTEYLQSLFNQKVEFERVVYLPLWGLSIDGLKVTSLEGARLFSAKNLLLRVPLLPFFLQKKIIVSQAVFNEPFIMVSPADIAGAKTQEKTPSGAEPKKSVSLFLSEGVDPFLPENVYLEGLVIRKGGVVIRDPKNKRKTLETIERLNLEIDFRRQPLLPVKGNLYLGEKNYGQIFFEGRWDLRKKAHEMRVKGDMARVPDWLKDKLVFGELAFRRLETDFELVLKPKGNEGYAFDLSTRKSAGSVNIGNKRFEGNFSMRLDGSYESGTGTTSISSGAVDVASGALKGFGPMGDLNGLKGTLFFDARQARFRNMQAQLAGVATSLNGRITLIGDRAFRIEARQRTDNLAALASSLPADTAALLGPASLKGDFTVEARIEGSLMDEKSIKRTGKITLRDAQWKVPELNRSLSRINGSLTLNGDRVGIHNLFFLLDKNQYLLSGGLDISPDGRSELALKHPKYTARLALVRRTDFIEVPLAEIRSGKSAVSLSGVVEPRDGMPFELAGKATADLDDFTARFAEKWPWLKTLKASGKAVSQVKVAGHLQDKRTWHGSMSAEIPRLKLYGKLPMLDTNIDIQYAGGLASLSYGKSKIYNGEVRFTGETAFTGTQPAFSAKLIAMDVDLSKSVPDFPFLDKKFSGLLGLTLDLKGYWGARESVAGQGDFTIKNGYLFATPLFKRLKNLTFVTIEGMDNVTFNSAEGAFTVSDGYLRTRNMAISSPLINIDIHGLIGLDTSLDLYVNSRFASEVIRESQTLGGFTPLLVNYAEGKITKYQVTGTVMKPVYQEV